MFLRLRIVYCIVLIFFASSTLLCFAQDIKPMQEFTSNDRILILAPHPDDEVVATGGVIQKALQKNAKVKVLFLTNGDHNTPAFIVYEKRLIIRQGEFIHMGQVRRDESLEALKKLGLAEKDCVFLGYPDSGTMEILLKYWGNDSPFKSILTRISKVPYLNCMSPGAPYVGESILNDIEKVIIDFKPTLVFVSSPIDANVDHCSLYLFLQIALWELEGVMEKPVVLPYLVHPEGWPHLEEWPKPRGYHPEIELTPPVLLKSDEIIWQRLDLTGEEVRMKHDAMQYYKIQNEYNPTYLATFARKNELVGNYSTVKLSRDGSWCNVGTALAYSHKDDNLLIRLALKNKRDKDVNITLFLLGYRKDSDFSKMPKLAISIGLKGLNTKYREQEVSVKDRKQRISSSKVQLIKEGNILILKIPLSSLNDPIHILACAKAGSIVLPAVDTAWRDIQFEQ